VQLSVVKYASSAPCRVRTTARSTVEDRCSQMQTEPETSSVFFERRGRTSEFNVSATDSKHDMQQQRTRCHKHSVSYIESFSQPSKNDFTHFYG